MAISLSYFTIIASSISGRRLFPPKPSPSVRFFSLLPAERNIGCSRSTRCSDSGLDSSPKPSDSSSSLVEEPDSTKKRWNLLRISSNELLEKLKRYGVSGILAYGLLNTAYYLTTFLIVWLYVAPVPGRMGFLSAAARFLKVMAMVWAGSQVTKLIRAGGALALAPFVERGLSWFTIRFGFESQGKAFMAIVGICMGLAVLTFVVITLLWS